MALRKLAWSTRSTPTATPAGSPGRNLSEYFGPAAVSAGEAESARARSNRLLPTQSNGSGSGGGDGRGLVGGKLPTRMDARAPRSPARDGGVIRPPPRPRVSGNESHYLASASGSQTDGADGGGESSSSSSAASDSELDIVRRLGDRLSVDSASLLTRRYARGEAEAHTPTKAGDRGRGDQVLVKKRSSSPRALRGHARGSAPTRERSWGSALLDTLEGNLHSGSRERRRPASPNVHASTRASRVSARGRPARPSPDEEKREPTPPLTLDSIRPGWSSPFPLFHIRRSLVFEVVIMVLPLSFALFRVWSMRPSALFPSIPAMPIRALALYILAIPFIALFRRDGHYFMAPFTDERGYRNPTLADDGIAVALSLPILLATATWWEVYSSADATGQGVGLPGIRPLIDVWEANGVRALESVKLAPSFDLSTLSQPLERARTLFRARYELVLLTSLNAATLLLHLVLARTVLRIERLPRSNTKRFFGFMAVAATISTAVWALLTAATYRLKGGIPLSPLEAAVSTYIQQSSFYIVSRLARRGFTLGELNAMTAAGNALCLEFWRLSRARWYYKRGFPYIPATFRAPTPIVAFQAVLIPGAFLSGFLLSPLLVISRHIASRPSHRLKWPTERERHRKLLAFGVAVGLFGIVFLMLGGWAGWMLGTDPTSFFLRLRRPWGWAARFFWYGNSDGVDIDGLARIGDGQSEPWWSPRRTSRGWRRIVLVGYWGATISSAIGGWQTHLVRARRIRMRTSRSDPANSRGSDSKDVSPAPSDHLASRQGATAAGKRLIVRGIDAVQAARANVGGAQQPQLRFGAEHAREEKAVHASLNLRRKFFHALAALMFVPGIAIDPAFTSLAFSVAFSLFTFAEYARYFALYPIGAPLHIFFTEFVDSKDSGPVILSHFYLLTGCAGGLWLEGRQINRFTGVLVLGIGDSLASIIGKLWGRTRWPGTNKTVEGTVAFITSVTFCAWALRLVGMVDSFSMPRYLLAVTLSALFEAASAQNDNLVIPLYMWSVVSLLDV
ncbi:hypothetical protein JCM10908_005278 [Rhodotorula pacifica]|uniref:dolichol kinase n=1 Tax=Rhodotorula pacifica TaxID=1495444 RepID=UPI0031721E1D